MKKETIIWSLVILAGALLLVARMSLSEHGMGKAYVKIEQKEFVHIADADPAWMEVNSDPALDYDLTTIPEDERIRWTQYSMSTLRDYLAQEAAGGPAPTANARIAFSWWNTLGLWIAAFFTLAIFSFLYKDNPFYKVAESVVVGVSAAYWMVVGFWEVIIPNLLGKIYPPSVTTWALPGLSGADLEWNPLYIFPLILGIMLVWRLAPRGAWIARWPLAFIIGTTAGIRLVGFIQADFLSQIRNTIIPVVVATDAGTFDFWDSLKNVIIIVGVLACLVYFFFSIEHKGIVGKTARVGIWFLMITFGAGFGYTVMGRIALLAIRIEFLFDDWLWLIDPTEKRELVAMLVLQLTG
jgi:hypothetical protein